MTDMSPPAPSAAPTRDHATASLELAIARLLSVGTYLSVGLLAIGVALMAISGRSPLDTGVPGFDLGRLPADLVAMRPEGALWLGLVCLLATPSARVTASLIGYLRRGERSMAVVAGAILLVVAVGVVAGIVLGAGPEG